MSLWIASKTDLGGHKKLYALCRELKIDAPTVVGHLHYLWWWTILNRSDEGDLIGLFPKDIAHAAKFDGEPKKFVDALIKTGWIDRNMKIHDWKSHAGPLLAARERKNRWYKNTQGTSKERSKNVIQASSGLVTEPNRTVPYSKDIKTGLLSIEDEQILRQDIAKTNGVDPNSESATVRVGEIVAEISKTKDVRKPIALARHKALKQ